MKKYLFIIVLLMGICLALCACVDPAAHTCESACPECGKCLDAACTEEACADKCAGHHVCDSVCPECGLCLNDDCSEDACSQKCAGHAPTSVNVKFVFNDGTSETKSYPIGSTVADIDVTLPSITSLTFQYWCADVFLKEQCDADDELTEGMVLYAKWNGPSVTVTLKPNFAGLEEIKFKVPRNTLIPIDESIYVRECYDLVAWYKDRNMSMKWDLATDKVTANVTLYVEWALEEGHEHTYTDRVFAPTCNDEGYTYTSCPCGDGSIKDRVDALGHDIQFVGDEYLRAAKCSREGCAYSETRAHLGTYEDKFVVTLDADKDAEIRDFAAATMEYLANLAPYDAGQHGFVKDSDLYNENAFFEENYYNVFDDYMYYIVEQYQYSYVFYCVEESEENTAIHEAIDKIYNDMLSSYYSLYEKIYNTCYREYFFSVEGGWTPEDIEMALALSASYGSEEYAEINNAISEIEREFREIENPDASDRVPELYEQFVALKNQMVAKSNEGKADEDKYRSYIDYAYANTYEREYTPDDSAKMRGYVKNHIKALIKELYDLYLPTVQSPEADVVVNPYYLALTNQSIFNNYYTSDLVADYFELLKSDSAEQEIDFYHHANELLKNGNYYRGEYTGAYSYWIGAQNTNILYFGHGSYSVVFTFVHEFGHYYNDVYNRGASMSYDLNETHSQGNEMLLLSWLRQNLAEENKKAYNYVFLDQMFNAMAIITLGSCVDEFEYCVYNQVDLVGNPTTYTADDYDTLFGNIMKSYGIDGILNSAYWRYVAIESSCYYISYAMSMLPCLELYINSMRDGLDVAMNQYFKLFTFTDDPTMAHVEYDRIVVDAGYAETLVYAGLTSPFDEKLYIKIAENLLTGMK
ncbi:MAG: InlB B-repeat-containing protein [Clostridia bacterium]|nr:InlB B-repeat-containing protein [Clostridia bacterium]